MLLQTNSYIVPQDKRSEHNRLMRRFRQTLARLGCDHFEVYEQVGANWGTAESAGRFVQILRFADRRHQLAVQAAERTDAAAQAVIAEFCDLINFAYQQEQELFAVSFFNGVLPAITRRASQEETTAEHGSEPEAEPGAEILAGEAAVVAAAGVVPGVSEPTESEMKQVDSNELEPEETELAELEPDELEPGESESEKFEPTGAETSGFGTAELNSVELEPAELESAELEPAELESAELEPELDSDTLDPIASVAVVAPPIIGEPMNGFADLPHASHMKLVEDELLPVERLDEKLGDVQTNGRIEPADETPADEPLVEAEHFEELEPEEEEFAPVSSGQFGFEPIEIEDAPLNKPVSSERAESQHDSPYESGPLIEGELEEQPELIQGELSDLHPESDSSIEPIPGELVDEEDDFHAEPEPEAAFQPKLPVEHPVAAELEAEPAGSHEPLVTAHGAGEHFAEVEELASDGEPAPLTEHTPLAEHTPSAEHAPLTEHEPVETHAAAHHPREDDDFMNLLQGELTEEDEERAHGFIEGELVDDVENEHLNGLSGHVKHTDELTGHEVRPPQA